MDNKTLAQENRFSPVFMLIVLFVNNFERAVSQC